MGLTRENNTQWYLIVHSIKGNFNYPDWFVKFSKLTQEDSKFNNKLIKESHKLRKPIDNPPLRVPRIQIIHHPKPDNEWVSHYIVDGIRADFNDVIEYSPDEDRLTVISNKVVKT